MKKVCIIGGGAAGVMAAYSASMSGAQVCLLEKNHRLCRKLLITGKGKCNITNMGDLEDFMENIPRNAPFLYSGFSAFSNYDLVSLMEEKGFNIKVERGARVFPGSDKASDVANFFVNLIKNCGVNIACGAKVDRINFDKQAGNYEICYYAVNGQRELTADAVIIATGGLSYPQTGSTGDGYRLAKAMGHSVTKLYPSLVALKVKEDVSELAGLSLKNIEISIMGKGGELIYRDFGEMLFTHNGVSGPVILSASARITERTAKESFTLFIDLKPALDEKKLDIRLLKDFTKNSNKDIINALDELLPKKIIAHVIRLSGIEPRKKVNEVTKSERKKLASILKAFPLTIAGTDGFDNAVITRGGISVSEINPKTMESKLAKGLFFAGEVIDVDGYTGGFNLQIAFSTGFLAGSHASTLKN